MKGKKREIGKFVYWTPRILSMIFILFLALFSLDVFDNCDSVLSCLLGLLVHNIPSLVLLIILIISWRHEIVGAISFFIAGLMYILFALIRTSFELIAIVWILQISGVAFIIAYLFYLNWKRKKAQTKLNNISKK